jgi:hypothetical protein
VPAPTKVTPITQDGFGTLERILGGDRKDNRYEEEEAAALLIQAFLRRKLKRGKVISTKKFRGSLSDSRRMSQTEIQAYGHPSAVEVTWADLTLRFVRYVAEHFTEGGDALITCVIILESWVEHLTKARTRGFDKFGSALELINDPNVVSLTLCDTSDLSELEQTIYLSKQNELNDLGVTVLLAHVIANLTDTGVKGSLADIALSLFTEMLNGGNVEVQKTLYEHLIEVDTDCRFLEYVNVRLQRSQDGLIEAKKSGTLLDSEPSKSLQSDCEAAIGIVRLVQLLCEGHHAGFQNYIRVQELGLCICCIDVLVF